MISELFYRNLIANSLDGILLTDETGKIRFASTSASQILGFEENEIVGKLAFDFVHPGERELGYHAFMDEVTQDPKLKYISVRLLKKSGDWLWCIVRGHNLMHTPEVKGMVIYFYDDTLRKTAEDELKRLMEQMVELEIQKQKQLTQATIDGQEKERLEIGKELHDNISQHLTTTRLYLEIARDKASGEAQEMVNLAHKGLSDIINEIRQLSQSLVPATLGDLGLVESVKDLCDGLKRSHAFRIDFIYRHFTEEGMPENVKLMLFRIIQEQINNIIRHSGADHFHIRLQSDAEYLMLEIVDNGKGFDTSNYKKGLGLANIRSRAELFNGKISIQAEPGKGCTLTVIIPKAIV
ncbi:MAG TPA: PAS domain-containing sensor histidine kinase [Chitinophagaceae bacterium]|nr:PAS domain-containing sensor histidine kinase [Chitinophagaceae bacterium]